MGNSQQSPKYSNTNQFQVDILQQKYLIEDTLNESSNLNEGDKRSPNIEELNSTRGVTRKTSEILELDQGKPRSKLKSQGLNLNLYETELPETFELLNQLPLIKVEKTRYSLTSYESPSGHKAQALASQPIIQFIKCNERLTYQGQWLRQQRDGFGLCIYQNGSIYVGSWINDLKDGHGRMIYENNDTYTGYWMQGKYHGFGIFSSYESYYEGNWENGEKDGQGLEIKMNKSKYEGMFKWGKKMGLEQSNILIINCIKGNSQMGNTKDRENIIGMMVVITQESGNVIRLMDLEHLLIKQMMFIKVQSCMQIIGSFVDDKKNGIGTFKWSNGTILKGIWVNGQIEGQATITKPNGESIIENYINGQKVA